MRRAALERPLAVRRARDRAAFIGDAVQGGHREAGHWRKMRPRGCARPRCGLCQDHPRELTRQELRALIGETEALREL